jgi:hypothetical protein
MSSEVREHVTAAADAETVVDNPAGPDYPAEAADSRGVSLFSTQNSDELRGRWDATQRAFVDDPRAAVERADHLVVETIQLLSTSFTRERSQLEEQWARGEDVSTEDLRVALRRYRSFFDRLLSA